MSDMNPWSREVTIPKIPELPSSLMSLAEPSLKTQGTDLITISAPMTVPSETAVPVATYDHILREGVRQAPQ